MRSEEQQKIIELVALFCNLFYKKYIPSKLEINVKQEHFILLGIPSRSILSIKNEWRERGVEGLLSVAKVIC